MCMNLIELAKKESQALEARAERLEECNKALYEVLEKFGFHHLQQYQQERLDVECRLRGSRPARVKSIYRRKTPEDVQAVLELTLQGKRTVEVAKLLNLAPNTISNIKKSLKDQGKL